MTNVFEKMSDKLIVPMQKFSEQKHLRSIRDGVICSIPFIIVGSVFLLLAMFPFPEGSGIRMWQKAHQYNLLIPYRLTFNCMALFMTFGIGYHLAQRYELHALTGGLISIAGFLVSMAPSLFNPASIDVTALDEAGLAAYRAMAANGIAMPIGNFSSRGVFAAIIVSIASVEILRFCTRFHITIKMPEQVPASVSRSFEAIFPVAFVVIIFGALSIVAGLNLETVVGKIVEPLIHITGNLGGMLALVLLNSFFWSFGIHGTAILDPIIQPLFIAMIGQNAEAHAAGLPIPHAMTQQFLQFFVYIGGSGAVLGLIIATFITAKSTYAKSLSRASAVPSVFNINEPIIFGYPIMLNPILIIPFILTPMLLVCVSWLATIMGLVAPAFIQPPWTLPAPIGAWLATGDWRAAILSIINIIIATLIYIPFMRTYDKTLLKEEAAS